VTNPRIKLFNELMKRMNARIFFWRIQTPDGPLGYGNEKAKVEGHS